ncbi:hypothetical protein PCYB_114870 [Plasmodium cynomolgi strain B]|uniref:Obg domain-containing protein n=1 Tax=Plasmodium cynomolgi (strain B) TaxID=1120755 RepID=K6VDZ5_PLACD|nr:hypothetical protein PCYB_114870 [Plasmodium cynomolgi strain B]GAB67467.1 hypothetical protein PCYB_114870 [Plasmodium cynomolgi strain B]
MGVLLLPTKGRRLYSIKIIDKVTKKSVKIYEHSLFGRNGKGKKSNEGYPHYDGESTFPTDEGHPWGQKQRGTPIVGVKTDVCKVTSRKESIFYESERIIKCESGAGGDGAISFKRYKRKVLGPLGIPNGGKGGNGGDVYLRYWDPKGGGPLTTRRKRRDGDKHVYVNNMAELPCVISATRGEKGKANQLRGKNGMSVFLHFNKMCHVYRLFPREGEEASCGGVEEATCAEVAEATCTDEPLHSLRRHTCDAQGTPLGDGQRDVLMVGRNNQWVTPHVKGDHHNILPYKEELRRKDERLFRKPYIVVINKCDVHFTEKIKRAEEAYRDIKAHGGDDVPVFFISAKYAMGIDKFVTHLRTCVQRLKHAKC